MAGECGIGGITYIYIGTKAEMEEYKNVFLKLNGQYDVTIENLFINRKLFSKKYQLKIKLKGYIENILIFYENFKIFIT